MEIIKCPTAYCAPSQHGAELSERDRSALRLHAEMRSDKQIRASEAARARGSRFFQYSPRNKRRI